MQAHGLRDFLVPMLNFVPGKRATAAESLRHPWLRGELPEVPEEALRGRDDDGTGRHGRLGERCPGRSRSRTRSRSAKRSRSPSR